MHLDVATAGRHPVGVDRDAWVRDNVQRLATGVVSANYPSWVATDVVVFGGIGIVLIAATYSIVERRRPSCRQGVVPRMRPTPVAPPR